MVIRPSPELTRRGWLSGGAVVAVAALDGCSRNPMPSNVPLHRKSAGAREDVHLLDELLGAERFAIAAYSAGMPLLGRRAADMAKQFLGQELAHAAELEGLIKQAGAQPSKPPAFYRLGNPRGELDVLRLLHRAERAQLAGYERAIASLEPPRLRAAAAAIFANDAQHMAVLRAVLGAEPVPSAFVGPGE